MPDGAARFLTARHCREMGAVAAMPAAPAPAEPAGQTLFQIGF